MANNFFLNNDPLLYNDQYQTQIFDIDRIRQQQQQVQQYDYLSELDGLLRDNTSISTTLANSEEYVNLSIELQSMIQNEIMSSIKWRINSNPNAVRNIQRQIELIKKLKATADDEQRKSIDEINDYIKNHSDMTFDDYRKMKTDKTKKK